jgi:hypothetical protein
MTSPTHWNSASSGPSHSHLLSLPAKNVSLSKADLIATGIKNVWELYKIDGDYSEANNLAAQHPEKLKELQAIFDVEARKYNVYPLDDRIVERQQPAMRPSLIEGRTDFIYYPGTVRLPGGGSSNQEPVFHDDRVYRSPAGPSRRSSRGRRRSLRRLHPIR